MILVALRASGRNNLLLDRIQQQVLQKVCSHPGQINVEYLMPTLKAHGSQQATPQVHGFPQVQTIVMGKKLPGLVLQLAKPYIMKNPGLKKAQALLPHFLLGLVLRGAQRQDCLLQVGATGVGTLAGGSNKVGLPLPLPQTISALFAESGAKIHSLFHADMYVAVLSALLHSNKLPVKDDARSVKRPCRVCSASYFPERYHVFLGGTHCCA